MDLGVGENNTGTCGVLDRKLDLTTFTSQPTDGSTQMVAPQRLDVLDFERFDVQIIQSEEGNRILDFEAHQKCIHKIRGFLNRTRGRRFVAGFYFHLFRFEVHAHVEFHMFRDRLI